MIKLVSMLGVDVLKLGFHVINLREIESSEDFFHLFYRPFMCWCVIVSGHFNPLTLCPSACCIFSIFLLK